MHDPTTTTAWPSVRPLILLLFAALALAGCALAGVRPMDDDAAVYQFVDDFSDNANKWVVGTQADGVFYLAIEDGQYIIRNTSDTMRYAAWNTVPLDTGRDYAIEARMQDTEDNCAFYGLTWAFQKETGDSLSFLVSDCGVYEFIRAQGDATDFIIGKTRSSCIRKDAPNDLRVERRGRKFRFFINQHCVATSPAMDLPCGATGFTVIGQGEVEADYLRVMEFEE
jgi:hypothetical protein